MNLKNMFNFKYKRTFLEALVFYVQWIVLLIIIVLIISLFISFVYAFLDVVTRIKHSEKQVEDMVGTFSHYISALICIFVTYKIIINKKIPKHWSIILFLLVISTSLLYGYGEALIGFVFTSILTMFKTNVQINAEN